MIKNLLLHKIVPKNTENLIQEAESSLKKNQEQKKTSQKKLRKNLKQYRLQIMEILIH